MVFILYIVLENKSKKIRALIGFKTCFYNSIQTELAEAVVAMMARAKRIEILMI